MKPLSTILFVVAALFMLMSLFSRFDAMDPDVPLSAPAEPAADDDTRGSYINIYGNENINGPGEIHFVTEGQMVMQLSPNGSITFPGTMTMDDRAHAFVQSVKRIWPEVCGHHAEDIPND